jgi:hypothetical protein
MYYKLSSIINDSDSVIKLLFDERNCKLNTVSRFRDEIKGWTLLLALSVLIYSVYIDK